MADNAFYPGYMPDATEGNPLIPGYYPGQKLPFKPKNIKPLKGFDFTMDHLLEEINDLELNLTNQGGYLPGWVKDRLVDDFQKQLQASVEASKGIADVETLDEYDANSLPGAFGITVNMNPLDWAKDPGKQAQKTLENWKKAVVNWGDVETRIKENLWTQVVKEDPQYWRVAGAENLKGEAPWAEATANRITSRMRSTGAKYETDSNITLGGISLIAADKTKRSTAGIDKRYELEDVVDPITGATVQKVKTKIDLTKGVEVFDTREVYRTVEDDLADVGSKVVAFERFSSFAPRRDDKFDDFQSSVFNAVDRELSYGKLKDYLNEDGHEALKAEYEVFHAKKAIADSMGKVNEGYTKGLKKGMEYLAMEGDTSKLITFERDKATNQVIIDPKTGLPKVKPRIDSATGKPLINSATGEVVPEFDVFYNYKETLRKSIEDLDTKVFGSSPTLEKLMDKKEFAALQKQMTAYRTHLEDMQTKFENARTALGEIGVGSNTGQRAAAILQIRQLELTATGGFVGKGFTGGDMVVDSLQRSLLRSMSDEFTQRGAKSGLGHLIAELEREHGELKISRLKVYVDRLKYERDSDAIDTVINMLERGNFMETIVWSRLKRYATGMTPAYYTEQVMKKLSYMGLVIGDDPRFEQHAWIKGASGIRKKFGSNLDEPGQLYGNWFTIKHKETYKFKNEAGIDVQSTVSFNGKIWGGKHFEGVDGLIAMRKLVDSGELTPHALAFMITNAHDGCFNDAAFLAKLAQLNGGKGVIPKDAENFALQLVRLREWVDKNGARLGGTVNTTDPGYWLGLIDALGKQKNRFGGIALTKRYAGLLEKISAKLNYLQNVILAKFGKFLAPVVYLKTIVVEAISEALLKLLDAAAGAASGGILAPITAALGRILKPIVRFIVRRLADATETFIKGVIQGDMFLLFSEFEKTFLKFAKYVLIITGIPFLVVFFFATMFTGTVMTTYSPIDPTAPARNYGSGPLGDGAPIDPNNPGGPGIPAPIDVPPLAVGGTVLCGGGDIGGHCETTCGSYGGPDGCHGSNDYWSWIGNCLYAIPYLPNAGRISWSDNISCTGSCAPRWDPASICHNVNPQSPAFQTTDYYGAAADMASSCTGSYARAVYAPDIGGITNWTVTQNGCAQRSSGGCADAYFYVNLSGSSGELVMLIHLLHLEGPAAKDSYAPGEFIQTYGNPGGGPHVHVEIMQNGDVMMPEVVLTGCQ